MSDKYEILDSAFGCGVISIIKRRRDEIKLMLLDILMSGNDVVRLKTVKNGFQCKNIPAVVVLSDESKIDSEDGIRISENHLQETALSDRTRSILCREHIKYQFFYETEGEIQFEYDCDSDVMHISERGAESLCVSSVIGGFRQNGAYKDIIGEDEYNDIVKKLSETDPDKSIVKTAWLLIVNGEAKWHRVSVRPLWDEENPGRISGVIGKLNDDNECYSELVKLRKTVHHDTVTGLYSREYIVNIIGETLDSGLCCGKTYAMIIIDLDCFKSANDIYGHIFGDRVLMTVGERLHKCVRKADIAGRFGGDEFIVFMEYCKNADILAERVFNAVHGRIENFDINISMGIALSPRDGADQKVLLNKADIALYCAKQNGKNQYCFYDESMKNIFPKG